MWHILVAISRLFSVSAYAVKPVKIAPGNTGISDGREFRIFSVECSNGTKQEITSWPSSKLSCVGGRASDSCARKQIQAAKTACKK